MTLTAACAFSVASDTWANSTGKERDTESGNDYFGARYYSSNMGRWLSPDWSAKEEPVPYANLGAPQTLNLYAYVGNSPMISFDVDGHQEPWNVEMDIPTNQQGLSQSHRALAEMQVRKESQGTLLGAALVVAVASGEAALDAAVPLIRTAWTALAGWALGNPGQIQNIGAGIAESLSGAPPGIMSPGFHLTPTGDIDEAAVSLAKRLGGQATVRIEGVTGSAANREFDAVSRDFVAQTFSSPNASLNPKNFLSLSRKTQIRATLEAASQTGKKAYFEFTGGAPAKEVSGFIQRNAERTGVGYEIH
jgi:RHS repeat-associated protein